MRLETARILRHETLQGDYRLLRLNTPELAGMARAGQFVHLRVPGLNETALRRPFSILSADGDRIEFLYKCVGRGTRAMTSLEVGDALSLLGPLGNGFPSPTPGTTPVLLAGGYGVAPLLFLARSLSGGGLVFIGGRSAPDILCADAFAQAGWTVVTATEDGSNGKKGLVTNALDSWLVEQPESFTPEFFACGPAGMLRAVAQRAADLGQKAWVSLDRRMGCGVGAFLACVVRTLDEHGSTAYARVCRDGPVFDACIIDWDSLET